MHTNLYLLAYTRPLCCYAIPSPAPFSVLAPNEPVEDVERVAVRLEVDELWRGVRRRCEPEAVVLSAVGRCGLDGHGSEEAVVERDGRDADGRRRVGRCDVNEFVAGGKKEVKEQQRQSALGVQKREPADRHALSEGGGRELTSASIGPRSP